MNNIPIYKSEIDIINRQDNEDLKRLLFVILVWSKTNVFNSTPCEDRKIAEYAGLNFWRHKVGEILAPVTSESEFISDELLQIRFHQTRKGSVRPFYYVLFAEQDDNKEVVFFVKDLDNCILDYIDYQNKQKRCLDCGVLLVGRIRTYCPECFAISRSRYLAVKRNQYYHRNKEKELRLKKERNYIKKE